MKKFLILLLILFVPCVALAAEPAIPADPALVSVLMPDYELAEGIINNEGNELRLLMRRPDGMLVFVGGVHDAEDGWQMTESTPLPEGSNIGLENFVSSLVVGESRYLVDVTPFANGTWGVTLMYPENGGLFLLGQNWIGSETHIPGLVGDHPWNDITRMDWSSLPASYEDAVDQLDSSAWARVHNPDSSDRLNLRTQPDKKSASLGKYYNGVPVRILENKGEWAKVDILGLEGWMMTEFLAIADEMTKAEYRGPWLSTVESGAMMYEQPLEDSPSCFVEDSSWSSSFYVIGCFNEEWYHVWCHYDGSSGYFRVKDLWEGNG